MREQQLQKKIIDWLVAHYYYVVKVITANRAGIPDIIACSPTGRFVAIEVKVGNNKPSALQEYNLKQINNANGIGLVAYDLDTVIKALASLDVQ